MDKEAFKDRNILLGVTGSIAAYKAAELCSRLVQLGSNVRVIMTRNATNFINPTTFETLTHSTVVVDMFERNLNKTPYHIELTDWAQCFAIVPATANILAKASCGIADDALSTAILCFNKEIIFAPAMNPKMWESPAVQNNCKTLRSLGHIIIEPEEGPLACGAKAKGRLPSLDTILTVIQTRCK